MLKNIFKILIVFTFFLLLNGCSNNGSTIVGEWEGQNQEDGTIIFKENLNLEMIDNKGKNIFESLKKGDIKYEIVNEVNPNQLYLLMNIDNKVNRVPFGIYKIENNKLIIRQVTEYQKTLGGISIGNSRYEFPENFNGILNIYNKIKY